MKGIYVTVSGQTWDQIALDVYGEERYCDRLMEANRDKLDIFVFPDGIMLTLPDKERLMKNDVMSDYPPWRVILNK